MSQTKTQSKNNKSKTISKYGGLISDIEIDEVEKYRKMAKKFAKDRAELREQLKKNVEETDKKIKNYEDELTETKSYFQNTLNKALEQVRFFDNANKNFHVIEILQKNINKITEEKENGEKKFLQKEEELKKNITCLQEQLENFLKKGGDFTEEKNKLENQISEKEKIIQQLTLKLKEKDLQYNQKTGEIIKFSMEKEESFKNILEKIKHQELNFLRERELYQKDREKNLFRIGELETHLKKVIDNNSSQNNFSEKDFKQIHDKYTYYKNISEKYEKLVDMINLEKNNLKENLKNYQEYKNKYEKRTEELTILINAFENYKNKCANENKELISEYLEKIYNYETTIKNLEKKIQNTQPDEKKEEKENQQEINLITTHLETKENDHKPQEEANETNENEVQQTNELPQTKTQD